LIWCAVLQRTKYRLQDDISSFSIMNRMAGLFMRYMRVDGMIPFLQAPTLPH
jgi:hypothetical protein